MKAIQSGRWERISSQAKRAGSFREGNLAASGATLEGLGACKGLRPQAERVGWGSGGLPGRKRGLGLSYLSVSTPFPRSASSSYLYGGQESVFRRTPCGDRARTRPREKFRGRCKLRLHLGGVGTWEVKTLAILCSTTHTQQVAAPHA